MLAPANLVKIYNFNLGHGTRVHVMYVRGIELIVCNSLCVKVTETLQNL